MRLNTGPYTRRPGRACPEGRLQVPVRFLDLSRFRLFAAHLRPARRAALAQSAGSLGHAVAS
jgi:hypothetical protein